MGNRQATVPTGLASLPPVGRRCRRCRRRPRRRRAGARPRPSPPRPPRSPRRARRYPTRPRRAAPPCASPEATTARSTHAELPEMSVSRDVTSPPGHDSATAMLQPRAASTADHGLDRSPVGADHGGRARRPLRRRRAAAPPPRGRHRRGRRVAARAPRPTPGWSLRSARRARPRPIQRLQALLGVRLAEPGDEHRAHVYARGRRPCRERALEHVSSIGLSSRGGPGSRISTCAPCSTHCPGAVPLLLSSTTPCSTTRAWRRLIAGIGMPRAAKRASSLAIMAGFSIRRPAHHAGHRLTRHVGRWLGPGRRSGRSGRRASSHPR